MVVARVAGMVEVAMAAAAAVAVVVVATAAVRVAEGTEVVQAVGLAVAKW